MCWLQNANVENNCNTNEYGINLAESVNCIEKQPKKIDWHLNAGFLVYGLTLLFRHITGLPDFVHGFGVGLSIVFILYGLAVSAGRCAHKPVK